MRISKTGASSAWAGSNSTPGRAWLTPDTAVLILQATPWSPSTAGPVTGDVVFVNIQTEKDFDQYKGKLAGKIVLLGAMRARAARGQAAL